jgi:rhamnosyltransferase
LSIDAKTVCAVIVAYRPDEDRLVGLLRALQPQVGGIVVSNNGGAAVAASPESWSHVVPDVSVLEMGGNLGVAAAQNRGIQWAKLRGYSHVILFDQDSEPEAGMVERLLVAWTDLGGDDGRVAAIGPSLVDRRDDRVLPFVRFGALSVKRQKRGGAAYAQADFIVSSGMLTTVAMFEKIGWLDEGLFIDNVDLDWCFRATHQGLALYGVHDARLLHQIGDLKYSASVCGRRYSIYQHRPLRQYYITRNRILLYGRAHSPWRWIVQDLASAAAKALVAMMFFPQRSLTFQMMLQGALDGAHGKSGEYRASR